MCTVSPDDGRRQLCLNCFARGNQLSDCESTHSCFTCRGRNHTLLHRGNSSPSPSNPSPRPRSRPNTPVATATGSTDSTVQNYFATGYKPNSKTRALIDSGSTVPAQQGRDSEVARAERIPYGASPDIRSHRRRTDLRLESISAKKNPPQSSASKNKFLRGKGSTQAQRM